MSISQNAQSYQSVATELNTPEPSQTCQEIEEESSGDFARLTPSSISSRLAFHNLVTSIKDEENWDIYSWHRRFIHSRNTLDFLEDDDEESTGGEGAQMAPPTKIQTGYWRLNMDLRSARPQFGWFIGRGRWQANSRDLYGAVDILLTPNATEPSVRGRHARFIHNLDSNRLLIQAEGTMRFNGETLYKGDRRELPKEPSILTFGIFEYKFSWVGIDQEVYRRQLDELALEVNHDNRPPLFMTPTPQYSEYLLDKYRIKGTFATGSSCIVCAATDMSGNPYAVKKIIARNRKSRLDVDEEVRNMRKLTESCDAPVSFNFPLEISYLTASKESISHFVELLTIEPSGPAGVYECYIVSKPLIATTLSGIFKSDLDNNKRLILVAQMLQGLNFIHANGCMHRDIKLDNILASVQPLQAVIIDFGHATWDRTSKDHMKGTIRYLAPEIISIKHMNAPPDATYDQNADVWSMGLTVFEFVCRFRLNHNFITSSAHRNIMNQEHWNKQHASDQEMQNLFDLLKQMLAWAPSERISAKDALDWTNRHGILLPTPPASAAGTKNKLASPTIIETELGLGKRRRQSFR